MAVQRSGPTPEFYKYIVENVLMPRTNPPSPILLQIVGANGTWLEIPSYQRGVSWEIEDLEEFLRSRSTLLGNVIMGQFNVNTSLQQLFPQGTSPNSYAVLVDGLQRFSVGTAILSILYDKVLNASPTMPHVSQHFAALSIFVATWAPVYLHNDTELFNHPRNAISSGYKRLKSELINYINDQLSSNASAFSSLIHKLFVGRQIAIDIYHNFTAPVDIMNTFIGINTVRVDLTPVDLLRANIIEKAQSSNWSSSQIEATENSFSDVFMDRQGEKQRTELLPFVSILLDLISTGNGHKVLPSWHGILTLADIQNLLDFVNMFLTIDKNSGDKYIWEIRNCGAIPWACLIGHYYRRYLNNGAIPTFINAGGQSEWPELHAFLCGVYRAILLGKIGKTRETAEHAIDGAFTSLADAGEEIAHNQSGASLQFPLNIDYIKSSLQIADLNRSKRLFNAMLLGDAPHSAGTFGLAFNPLEFGRKSTEYHIDHLIPQSMKNQSQPGAKEIETIKNFAPITSDLNKAASATPCSSKLSGGGIYANHIQSNPDHHFYCDWLLSTQSAYMANLDQQIHLEPNMNPDIGNERINKIADVLRLKL